MLKKKKSGWKSGEQNIIIHKKKDVLNAKYCSIFSNNILAVRRSVLTFLCSMRIGKCVKKNSLGQTVGNISINVRMSL